MFLLEGTKIYCFSLAPPFFWEADSFRLFTAAAVL